MIDEAELERRVQTIRHYAHKLDELARLDTIRFTADERLPICAERYLQIACEACIEVGLLLISGLKLRRPSCYEDIGEILTGAGFATSDYAPQIERIIKVRNMLIHGYNGIEPHALHNQLGPRIMELEFFATQATLFIRRHA
jgi:uncharacterized protein YutE (UPF0331/DUF86 family)